MCKEMMGQRNKIKTMLDEALNKCLEKIRANGGYDTPIVIVDMEKLFIANREYFEHQGFFFESHTKIVNNRIKCYAKMKLGGDGELAREFWKKIREAREVFVKNQRKKICDYLREATGSYILVDLNDLLFENKMYFEECGFVFEPKTTIEDGEVQYLVCMRKRR